MPWKLKRACKSKERMIHTFLLLLLHNRIEDLFKNTLLVTFFLGWQQVDTMSQASAGLCHPLLQVMAF